MNYDNEMEDQVTENVPRTHKVNERGMSDSILSQATDPRGPQKVIVTGNYEDYREFSVGKFDFNSSTISNEGFPGRAYEEPQVNVLPQQRNSHQAARFASQALLSPHQQLSQGVNRPQHNSRYEYPVVSGYLNNDVSQITNSPSEITRPLGMLSQKNMGNVGMSNSEIEGDNGTEFTEQIENESNKIDLEYEAKRLDEPSLVDDETIFGEDD